MWVPSVLLLFIWLLVVWQRHWLYLLWLYLKMPYIVRIKRISAFQRYMTCSDFFCCCFCIWRTLPPAGAVYRRRYTGTAINKVLFWHLEVCFLSFIDYIEEIHHLLRNTTWLLLYFTVPSSQTVIVFFSLYTIHFIYPVSVVQIIIIFCKCLKTIVDKCFLLALKVQ